MQCFRYGILVIKKAGQRGRQFKSNWVTKEEFVYETDTNNKCQVQTRYYKTNKIMISELNPGVRLRGLYTSFLACIML